jgi:excisionase family DNA binding protein
VLGRSALGVLGHRAVFVLVFSPETGSTTSHELLTTGQVARLLGCSRQHVVDLCTSGVLPYVSVRTHRRVRRRDAERLAGGTLTRDQERSLWLHRVVAGRLALETDRVMELAAKNLRRLRKVHTEGMAARWLDRWEEILQEGPDAVFEALTSRAEWAIEQGHSRRSPASRCCITCHRLICRIGCSVKLTVFCRLVDCSWEPMASTPLTDGTSMTATCSCRSTR